MSKCKAIQQSDQMYCKDCRLLWDMNDPNPPECKVESLKPVPLEIKKAFFTELKGLLFNSEDKHD